MAITTVDAVKDYLGIATTDLDAKINTLIPFVESVYQQVRNAPFDTDDSGNVLYPSGSDITAAQMIGYLLSQDSDQRFVSATSIGSYSVSYANATSKHGFPPEITSQIKRYTRIQ